VRRELETLKRAKVRDEGERMATLEIRLFGPLHLGHNGQGLDRYPGKRVAELLAYLILNRYAAHPRDYIAGLFWGDGDETKARHSLNTALWRLHGILEQLPPSAQGQPRLRVDQRSLGFNADSDYWLDVAEFESRYALAAQASTSGQRMALLAQAVALYRADLLPDCYEDWCLVERERLQRLHLNALSQLLTYHTAQGDHTAAIGFAHRILAFDPLREEIHRDLVALYLAARQPTAALRQYRACEEILRRELGVAPMPETRALLARALGGVGEFVPPAHSPATAPPAILARPAPADPAANIREIAKLIDQAQARLREAGQLLDALASGLGRDEGAETSHARTARTLTAMMGEVDQLLGSR
jgi:DNA-binding SARP family transcriptional activator